MSCFANLICISLGHMSERSANLPLDWVHNLSPDPVVRLYVHWGRVPSLWEHRSHPQTSADVFAMSCFWHRRRHSNHRINQKLLTNRLFRAPIPLGKAFHVRSGDFIPYHEFLRLLPVHTRVWRVLQILEDRYVCMLHGESNHLVAIFRHWNVRHSFWTYLSRCSVPG